VTVDVDVIDDAKQIVIAALRMVSSEEVVSAVADTQVAFLNALMSRGFTREEAMVLLSRGNLFPNTKK
jgi:hypothetical protein